MRTMISCAAMATLAACGALDPNSDGSGGSGTGTQSTGTSGSTTGSTTTTNSQGSTETGGTTGDFNSTTPLQMPPLGSGGSTPAVDCPAGTASGNTCDADGWCNYAQAAFTNNCGGCHGTYRYLANVQSDESNIQSRISGKSMPQNATLSSDDYTRMLKWLSCGAAK